jgi:hypothetical protein
MMKITQARLGERMRTAGAFEYGVLRPDRCSYTILCNKSHWLQEDELLGKLVEETGTDGSNLSVSEWAQIAKRFGGRRRGKECRERSVNCTTKVLASVREHGIMCRWENKLRPGLKEGEWSREEHEKIMTMAQVCAANFNAYHE